MATAAPLRPGLPSGEAATALAAQWRSSSRAATLVAVVTSPAAFPFLNREVGWNVGVQSYNLILSNRGAVEKIADQAVARGEIYGDELIELLDSVGLRMPEVDLLEEESWPKA